MQRELQLRKAHMDSLATIRYKLLQNADKPVQPKQTRDLPHSNRALNAVAYPFFLLFSLVLLGLATVAAIAGLVHAVCKCTLSLLAIVVRKCLVPLGHVSASAVCCVQTLLGTSLRLATHAKGPVDSIARFATCSIAVLAASAWRCACSCILCMQEWIAVVLLCKIALLRLLEMQWSRACQTTDIQESDNTCVVCFDDLRDHIFVPCGHVCLCTNCAGVWYDQCCPICRQANTRPIRMIHA